MTCPRRSTAARPRRARRREAEGLCLSDAHLQPCTCLRSTSGAKLERDLLLKDFQDKLFVAERASEARKYANELFKQEKLEEAAAAYQRRCDSGC